MAEYGLTSIFYFIFAAVVFLIPTSLIAAELAATFPKQGGVFRWVSEAFGPRWGFAALYYQWQAIVIWFPTVLIYGAVALAYIWWPQSFDKALAANKLYTIAVVLGVYWFVTLFTFRGVGASARLSSLGGLFGTIIPGAILILLAGIYVVMGKPIHLPLHDGFFPDFSKFQNMVLAAGVFLYYAGMEIQAVHIKNLPNPTRNYPLSVLIAAVMVVVIFILGTLAVGVVIPQKSINLNQSLLIAYRDLWGALSLPWLGNIMALMLVAGVLGQASALVGGISTGLFTVGKAGYLPHNLQNANKHAMPVTILLLQGGFISLLCIAFAVVPSVQSTYQMLSQMATIIYLVMYLIMFVAAIRLRYTQPNKTRPFRIPGGNLGMWAVGLIGLAGRPCRNDAELNSAEANQHRKPRRLCRCPACRGARSLWPYRSSYTCFTSRPGRRQTRTSSRSTGRPRAASPARCPSHLRLHRQAPPQCHRWREPRFRAAARGSSAT